jgi:hypothetical protein
MLYALLICLLKFSALQEKLNNILQLRVDDLNEVRGLTALKISLKSVSNRLVFLDQPVIIPASKDKPASYSSRQLLHKERVAPHDS